MSEIARYIDADALYQKLYPLDLADKRKYTINAKAVADAIDNIPTADVVPRAEVEKLELKLAGVMRSVDKWLDGDELAQDEVNRAATMREKTLRIVEGLQAEVAREILDEIIKIINNEFRKCERDEVQIVLKISHAIFELKKKYTEGGDQA